jgi:putative phosphoribosyl transferase
VKISFILAIPPGGVVTGTILSKVLAAELDVVTVRKLRAEYQPVMVIGAVSEDGFVVFDPENEHA